MAVNLSAVQLTCPSIVASVTGALKAAEQLAFLWAKDCREAQGFYICPPLPAEDAFDFLIQHSERLAPLRETKDRLKLVNE